MLQEQPDILYHLQEVPQTLVGQTKNSLRQRFTSHFYLIVHKKTEHEVPRHLNSKEHRGIHDVEIDVLEFIKNDAQKPESKSLRLRTEYSWIQRLHSQIPLGMNKIRSHARAVTDWIFVPELTASPRPQATGWQPVPGRKSNQLLSREGLLDFISPA